MQDHRKPKPAPDGTPPDRAQRNFTDPDSGILASRDGFLQGYDPQIAMGAARQVIVAERLVTTAADHAALMSLVDAAAHRTFGRKPRAVSADSGLATEANLAAMAEGRIAAYLPPGRSRHGNQAARSHHCSSAWPRRPV